MTWRNDNQAVQGGIGVAEGEPNCPQSDVDSLLSRTANASRRTRKAVLRRLGKGGAGIIVGLPSPSSSSSHPPGAAHSRRCPHASLHFKNNVRSAAADRAGSYCPDISQVVSDARLKASIYCLCKSSMLSRFVGQSWRSDPVLPWDAS